MGYDYGERGSTARLSAWQFHIDERLEWLPSYSEEPLNTLFIEWVYTIDLDREIIHIKSQSAESSFELLSIPRQLQWAQDFEGEEDDEDTEQDDDAEQDEDAQQDDDADQDEHEERDNEEENKGKGHNLLAKPRKGHSLAELLKPVAPSRSLLAKYDSLEITKVQPKKLAGPVNEGKHIHHIRELLFSHFIDRWGHRLSKHILLCQPIDFIYREVIFAILSLASGEFKILADQSPVPDRRHDLGVRLGSPNGPSILPDFGSGMHAPNTLPGSAPDSSIYWFNGAVVLLVDRLVDDDGLKAAIAIVTEFGRESSQKTFDALVTDIRSFMLIRVRDTGVVQHTNIIGLVDHAADHATSFRRTDISPYDSPCEEEEVTPVVGDTAGFDILINFFEIVAAYTLKPWRPTAKQLPNELYDRIIEMVDPDTYLNCFKVADTFRDYVQQHIWLSQQPNLSSVPSQHPEYSHHVIKGVSPTTSELVIFDAVESQVVESNLWPFNEGDAGPRWTPVVGHDKRQSMMVDCSVTISALASHSLPIAEDQQPVLDDPDFALLQREGAQGLELRRFGLNHFCIPKFAGARDVSLAWESYLRHKLMKSPATIQSLPWNVSPEAHRYLLPPRTESILLESYISLSTDANGTRYDGIAGLIWLKKPVDFWMPRIWARTLREAQEYLNSEVVQEMEKRRPMRQGLLVIAFGTKAKCFEWKNSGHRSHMKPVMTPLDNGALLDIAVNAQRERFEELFGTFRDEAEAAEVAPDSVKKAGEDAHSDSENPAGEDAAAGGSFRC